MKIEIFDTTLRDGGQCVGISFTEKDKLQIIGALDSLGVDYIEAGNCAIEEDMKIFEAADRIRLKNAKLVAFSSTCKPGSRPEEDSCLKRIANSPVEYISVVGKADTRQVRHILCTTPEENLRIIRDTVSYLVSRGKKVIFDAEHFFDGFADSSDYALGVIREAHRAGASTIVLCDTNGGMLPSMIRHICEEANDALPGVTLGIHCHNDMGLATACALSAVEAGITHIHATVSGIGERCGNTDLNVIVPLLELSLGYECIGSENLKTLTPIARFVNEVANRTFDESEPFVGSNAYTHKAGMHIDGVTKNPASFEHIPPELVGNHRGFVVSSVAGRTAIFNILKEMVPGLTRDSDLVTKGLATVKELEASGYRFENASASLELRLAELAGIAKEFFELQYFKVLISEAEDGRESSCSAVIRIRVGDSEEITADEGEGPVNAVDKALRKALTRFYPSIAGIKLCDFKVRVLDSGEDTAAKVLLYVSTTDGQNIWKTTGVSADIVSAAWQAIRDSLIYFLQKENNN